MKRGKMNKLGKPGDYIMDKEIQAIVDMHDGNVKEMNWTMCGLNIEIQYIRESTFLTEEEREAAIKKYKEVIEALRRIVNGEEK